MKHIYFICWGLLTPVLLFSQISLQIQSTPISCYGGNNGTAMVQAQGGQEPYNYLWTNGQQTSHIQSLAAGTYTVTVTDNTGATAVKNTVLMQPPPLGATLNGQPQICSAAPDGFTYTIPTGGTPPYTFTWSNDVHTQLNNFLPANTYSVTVTDTKGCTATGSYVVALLDIGLYLFTDSEKAQCPNANNGSALVNVLSGTAPYEYNWSTGQTASSIAQLNPGTYTVTVTDANGCAATKTATVEKKDVDPSFVQILQPQCSGALIDLETPPDYQIYQWNTLDSSDSIVTGNGTNSIQVRWGLPGQKQVSVSISNPVTECSTATLFEATVYECAVASEEIDLDGFTIGPNPFSSELRLKAPDDARAALRIDLYTSQGQLIQRVNPVSDNDIRLETNGLPAGLYHVRAFTGNRSKSFTLVKINGL